MRIPTQVRSRGIGFNITPMIDVVFLLIIFFLIASYLAQTENTEDVELAAAATGQSEAEDASRRMVVTVTAEERYLYGTRDISAVDFSLLVQAEKAEHPDIEVRIRADRRVPYRLVEPLLTACAQAGITKVNFNVLPGGG